MSEKDKREKLSQEAFNWVGILDFENETHRSIAHISRVSTKYVKKILSKDVRRFEDIASQMGYASGRFTGEAHICEGCHRVFFTPQDLCDHHAIWSSGGTKPLSCGAVAPQSEALKNL